MHNPKDRLLFPRKGGEGRHHDLAAVLVKIDGHQKIVFALLGFYHGAGAEAAVYDAVARGKFAKDLLRRTLPACGTAPRRLSAAKTEGAAKAAFLPVSPRGRRRSEIILIIRERRTARLRSGTAPTSAEAAGSAVIILLLPPVFILRVRHHDAASFPL